MLSFTLYLRAISKYKPPGGGGGWGAYIWKGDLTQGFLRYEFGGLIFRGAYFRNFTVCGFGVQIPALVSCARKADSYKKVCGFKSIRIRVEEALGTFLVFSVS